MTRTLPAWALSENSARVSVSAIAWWRDGLSHELAYRYWRDIHGTIDARLPGFHLYRQLHCTLGARPDLFVGRDGIETAWGADGPPQAVAYILLPDQDALDLCVSSRLFFFVENDNLELVERNVHYTATDASRTVVDRREHDTVQGTVESSTLAVFLRRREGADAAAFRSHVDELVDVWAADTDVSRLRFQHLGEADGQRDLEPEHLHDVWLELVVADEAVTLRLAEALDPDVVESVQTVEAEAVFTLVCDGRPTTLGLRGWDLLRTVREIGAEEAQNDPELLELLYGPVVHGATPMTATRG